MKEIFLNNQLTCQIRKRKRVKNMTLSVKSCDTISITIPRWVSYDRALKFLQEKQTWIQKRIKEQKKKPPSLLDQGSRQDYLKNREKARRLAYAKIFHFNRHYNLDFKKAAIRDQKTRWGSCSENGSLNFNFRIVWLEEKYVDYLVVHELCHLGQMNHSPKFWNLVKETIPNYRQLARELRKM